MRCTKCRHRIADCRCGLDLRDHLIERGLRLAVRQVVADAGGSPSKMGDDLALRRMERHGVTLTGTNQLIAELAADWSTPAGGRIVREVVMAAMPKS